MSIIEPLNHGNLFYFVKVITGPENGEDDLGFIIPDRASDQDISEISRRIPSTIVYVDKIRLGIDIAATLRNRLPGACLVRPPVPKVWDGDPCSHGERMVCFYHAGLSATMKKYMQTD